jgi:hypothetical protein
MAATTQTALYVPQGVNESNIALISFLLTTALAAGDTLDLTLPAGVDKDLLPQTLRVYSVATPAVDLNVASANLSVTNHNRTTGVTRLTAASAGIAAGSSVTILYTVAA